MRKLKSKWDSSPYKATSKDPEGKAAMTGMSQEHSNMPHPASYLDWTTSLLLFHYPSPSESVI